MPRSDRLPSIADLSLVARRRIPHFVWEFLDSATGRESAPKRDRRLLDDVRLMPSVLHGETQPDLTSRMFGRVQTMPFGVAPVGMSGLVWPNAERLLAAEAARSGLPYTLSTVATVRPEDVETGAHSWFQLYPPRDEGILRSMLERIEIAGFGTLVLTLDVPMASRRERQTRGGLSQPPKITPRIALQVARCPIWAAGMARHGMPRMAFIDDYAADLQSTTRSSITHAGYLIRTAPDWDYLARLRELWRGRLVVKGVLDEADVPKLEAAGIDAIWVSNHAGRQFDGGPSAVNVLPGIRKATSLPIVADGAVAGGLDILRYLALGADFVMLGRAWHYALGALGARGPAHLTELLRSDLIANLAHLGCETPLDVRGRLISP